MKTKLAYFDCIAGISGDMMLGALVDAGLSPDVLRRELEALHLPEFEIRVSQVMKHAFAATKVDVIVHEEGTHARPLEEILRLVEASGLATPIKEKAAAIFRRIGEAEASIHRMPVEHVHLHELGGVDTIVDVVGTLVGLDALGIEQIVASPLPLGRGFISGAHGQIPLPAPATVALLRGVPVVGSPVQAETVTPTGAALLASLASSFGPIPPMRLESVGYGAGTRDLPIPNVLRLLLGEASPDHHHGHAPAHAHHHSHEHYTHGTHGHAHHHDDPAHPPEHTHSHEPEQAELVVLETNVDDMPPEFSGHLMGRLFEAGALDVYFAPIQMKKNRPATLVWVLCHPEDAPALRTLLFVETTTLGVRTYTVTRYALPRESGEVETPYGPISVKIAHLPGGAHRCVPEYEACRRIAEQQGVPLLEVYRAAERACLQHD